VHLIGEAYQYDAERSVDATHALTEDITAMAVDDNITWPFIDIPSFEVFGSHTVTHTHLELAFLAPLVTLETIEDWTTFSVEKQAWISRSFELDSLSSRDDEQYRRSLRLHEDIVPYIHRFDENSTTDATAPGQYQRENGEGPYAPIYYMTPPPEDTSIINFNVLSYPAFAGFFSSINHEKGISVVSEVIDLGRLFGDSNNGNELEDMMEHPRSIIVETVYDSFTGQTPQAVGFVAAVVQWDKFLNNILPAELEGILAVLKNSCGQSYSYIINGERGTLMPSPNTTGISVNALFVSSLTICIQNPTTAINAFQS
jgi:hypothetical protein